MSDLKYWRNSQEKYRDIISPSQYAQKIETYFPPNSKVLDLGGARGNDAVFFSSKGHLTTVLDITSPLGKKISQGNKQISFIRHDLEKVPLPLQDHSFDIVYSRLTLQYFKESEIIEIFKEIVRVLRPSGKGFIAIKSSQDTNEMNSLLESSEQMSEGVFLSEGIVKTRYNHEQLSIILKEAQVFEFKIREISELLEKSNKHGNNNLMLTEIRIDKTN